MQRFAHASAPLALALGVFGYFYTVVPVFQYQRLQEQAAKIEREKVIAENQLAQLRADQDKVSANIGLLRWELILQALMVQRTAARIDIMYSRQLTPIGDLLRIGAAPWAKPYENLLDAIEVITQIHKPPDIPSSYYAELKEFVVARKFALQCDRPNFKLLDAQFRSEMVNLDATTQASLEQIRANAAAAGERLENPEPLHAPIKNTMQERIEKKYLGELSLSASLCHQAEDAIVQAFRVTKGLSR